MDEYTEEQARADADALVARLIEEPALRQAVLDDPRTTLLEAGLREDTVDEIEKAMAGVEVEGFMPNGHNWHVRAGSPVLNPSGGSAAFGTVLATVFNPAQTVAKSAVCGGGPMNWNEQT